MRSGAATKRLIFVGQTAWWLAFDPKPPQPGLMPDIATIIQNGAGNAWLYLPLAVLLGALHSLEPGHSKSLMAAFIVAIHVRSTQ